MQATNKAVRCDCGHEVQAVSEEELLGAVQEHAREAHRIDFSRDDALLIVLRTELQWQWLDNGARDEGASTDGTAEPDRANRKEDRCENEGPATR